MPPFKLGLLFSGHAVGIIVDSGRHRTVIVLVFQGVEFVGEESLTQLVDPEGGWKVGQREREKAQRVLEGQSIRCQGKDFGAPVIWSVTSRCVA